MFNIKIPVFAFPGSGFSAGIDEAADIVRRLRSISCSDLGLNDITEGIKRSNLTFRATVKDVQ